LSKGVGTAVIGLGTMGSTHAEWSATLPEAELKVVCDTMESRAKKIAAKYKVDYCTDYHDALERKDVEAVIIVTPTYLHAPIAIEAAKAGKHVAVEKPMCLNLAEANEMMRAVKNAGVLDAYFENLCFSPSYTQAKKIIKQGGVGDVFFIRCCENVGGGVEVVKEMFNALEKKKERGRTLGVWYYDYKRSGGGLLISAGIHCIMYARYILDREPAVKVYAELRNLVSPDPRVEDLSFVTVSYKNGQVAWIESCHYALGTFDDRAEIYGTKGTIFLDLYRSNPIKVYSQPGYSLIGASMFGSIPGADKSWSYPAPDEKWSLGYWHEQRHFLRSILAGERPKVNFEDGRASLEVVIAAYKSRDTGTAISLPIHK